MRYKGAVAAAMEGRNGELRKGDGVKVEQRWRIISQTLSFLIIVLGMLLCC